VDGPLTVQSVAHSVRAEGVERIALVSDEPQNFNLADFPRGTTLSHRREMDRLQRELREIPGVTVLIYAQTCATEKRRQRKRGLIEDPKRVVVINELVCEGCGDCSVESNCLSVIPKETPFGRKRQIDQSNCNKDFSCLNGFCPSFVTVEGGERRRKIGAVPEPDLAGVAAPTAVPIEGVHDLLVTGVGGTGVVTVGALITMAAHLEGKGASVLDFMGFAQKFGPVLSYIRLAGDPAGINQVRIEKASADALIACDLVVSSSPKASRTYDPARTRAVLNTAEMATGDFVRHRDASLNAGERIAAIASSVADLLPVDANRLAGELMGDTIYANVLLLGAAFQAGLVPVSLAALERAIELNNEKIEQNKRAFAWGRLAAARPDRLPKAREAGATDESLAGYIERRAAFLVDYQD
jgi:indolepyruvate ferredoxin oxidoreductase